MKKLIFITLFLFAANLSATVVVPHTNPAIYAAAARHRHSAEAALDNSFLNSLIRKDYYFHCKQCDKDFVIHDMLYHENTDMYFYYKQRNGLAFLQPYEGTKLCDKCSDKQILIFVGICLGIALLIISIVFYFDRD